MSKALGRSAQAWPIRWGALRYRRVTSARAWDRIPANGEERRLSVISSITEMRVKLEELRSEHRDLDDVIQRLTETSPFNQLQIQRLKKRKLALKDQMIKLEKQAAARYHRLKTFISSVIADGCFCQTMPGVVRRSRFLATTVTWLRARILLN